MKKLRDILADIPLDKVRFYVVPELIGTKNAYEHTELASTEENDITEVFISPAMMKLLDDKEASLSDILLISDAIPIYDAPAFIIAFWKKGSPITQPTIKKELACQTSI
jgi:hypothetical protein